MSNIRTIQIGESQKLVLLSSAVKINPCAYRGSYDVTISGATKTLVFDPEARITSEYTLSKPNSTGLRGMKSYLENFSDNVIKCVLNGYVLELDLGSEADKTNLFVNLILSKTDLTANLAASTVTGFEDSERSTWYVTNIKRTTNANVNSKMLDSRESVTNGSGSATSEYVFLGLVLTHDAPESLTNSDQYKCYSLQITDSSGNAYQPSLLPSISSGKAANSILLGEGLKAESTSDKVAVGKYNEDSNYLFEVANGADDEHRHDVLAVGSTNAKIETTEAISLNNGNQHIHLKNSGTDKGVEIASDTEIKLTAPTTDITGETNIAGTTKIYGDVEIYKAGTTSGPRLKVSNEGVNIKDHTIDTTSKTGALSIKSGNDYIVAGKGQIAASGAIASSVMTSESSTTSNLTVIANSSTPTAVIAKIGNVEFTNNNITLTGEGQTGTLIMTNVTASESATVGTLTAGNTTVTGTLSATGKTTLSGGAEIVGELSTSDKITTPESVFVGTADRTRTEVEAGTIKVRTTDIQGTETHTIDIDEGNIYVSDYIISNEAAAAKTVAEAQIRTLDSSGNLGISSTWEYLNGGLMIGDQVTPITPFQHALDVDLSVSADAVFGKGIYVKGQDIDGQNQIAIYNGNIRANRISGGESVFTQKLTTEKPSRAAGTTYLEDLIFEDIRNTSNKTQAGTTLKNVIDNGISLQTSHNLTIYKETDITDPTNFTYSLGLSKDLNDIDSISIANNAVLANNYGLFTDNIIGSSSIGIGLNDGSGRTTCVLIDKDNTEITNSLLVDTIVWKQNDQYRKPVIEYIEQNSGPFYRAIKMFDKGTGTPSNIALNLVDLEFDTNTPPFIIQGEDYDQDNGHRIEMQGGEIRLYNSISKNAKSSSQMPNVLIQSSGAANFTGQVSAQTFYATSDRRLKENLEEYHSKKSVLDLPVYKYDFIDGKKDQIGCLAQDLQEICPEIVSERDDGYLMINEPKIIYLLLDEVKKLKAEVDELKSR